MWSIGRPLLGVAGLLTSGAGAFVVTAAEKDQFWSGMLMTGGWIMIAALAIASLGLVAMGLWPPIRHLIDQDPHAPSK